MLNTSNTKDSINELKSYALNHLWMHNRDWVKTGEEGGPDIMVEGNGIYVTDIQGKTWIDVNGGYNSVNVGYGRKEIADRSASQMRRLQYFPQGTTTAPLIHLSEKISSISPGNLQRTWPVSGGSEANETAIKIAKSYHKRTGDSGRYKIISRTGSYHGATGGVMWLGGTGGIRSDYEPAMPGMIYAPQPNPYRCQYGSHTAEECAVKCAEAVEDLILLHGPETVAALIAEPVSASSIAAVPGDPYWPMTRAICDKYGVILIADEVITGFGRTGKMFASEHWGLEPDIMTVAKGITSSYLPLAAAISTTEISDAFAGEQNLFKQALTFGGHPVCAEAALANIEIIETENLVENSANIGQYFLTKLKELEEIHPVIGDCRGLGLLLGVELVKDRKTKESFSPKSGLGDRLSKAFRANGLILFATEKGFSVGPPLCITKEEVDKIVVKIDKSLLEIEGELQIH
jgi:adenosylmethionine-8-amino-7-oxononanoate aminotransferase